MTPSPRRGGLPEMSSARGWGEVKRNKDEGVVVLSNASDDRNRKVWARLPKKLGVGKDRHLWGIPGGAFF